ncbi:MAG: phosphatase PAP2 family protein [Actinobacteria bacterium]|nr:phosphatase PAP2 family protein [Actinomycetota bacterium]
MAGRPSLVSAARPPRDRSSAGRHLLVALAGLALLGVCGLVARNGRVGAIERGAFRAVNDLPDWLYRFLWVFQQFGNLVIALVVAVVIALLLRRPTVALAAGAAVGLKLVLERAVKQVVERQRPGTSIGSAIHARGDVSLQGLSFVSGHSVIVTAVAGLLTPILPGRWKPVPWVIVVLNGVTRVYVGAHNPLDVVGGLGLGLVIAGVLNALICLIPRLERARSAASAAVEG